MKAGILGELHTTCLRNQTHRDEVDTRTLDCPVALSEGLSTALEFRSRFHIYI